MITEDTYEAKHERRMRQVNMLKAEARTMFRTVGPRVSAAQDEDFSMRHCLKCNPPPEVHTCPMCDWQCAERWRLLVHLDLRPDWCVKRGEKKARIWAAKS